MKVDRSLVTDPKVAERGEPPSFGRTDAMRRSGTHWQTA